MELIVVIVIAGILATVTFATYHLVVRTVKNADASQLLGTVIASEQSWYQLHGSFATTATTLASMDHAFTWAKATTPSTSTHVVSVAAGSGRVGLAMASSAGTCEGALVLPLISTTRTTTFTITPPSTCTGTAALAHG